MRRALLLGIVLGLGCTSSPDLPGVPVDAGRSNAREVLRFYLGSFVGSAAVDSILIASEAGLRLDLDVLRRSAPEFWEHLEPGVADGRIDQDELQAAVRSGYARARGFPASVRALAELTGYDRPSDEWMVFRVRGSMSPFERRLYMPVAAVSDAIERFAGPSGELVYPVGTTVVAEHLDGDDVVETTVMIRRSDGYWDFVAYDADGALADAIHGDPEPLEVPTQCFGCHYGTRLFEPERSFPARPMDGPHGPRMISVPASWIDADVVRALDEHRRRDDGLLGLYATLLVSRWRAEREAGVLSEEALSLLEATGF